MACDDGEHQGAEARGPQLVAIQYWLLRQEAFSDYGKKEIESTQLADPESSRR